jgi:hypothetical protein
MNQQTTILIVAIAVIVLIAGAVAAWLIVSRRRTEALKHRFGTEYKRALEAEGSRSNAESELLARAKRVEQLELRPLSPGDRDRFAQRWRATQASFVDDPVRATSDADALVEEVMQARGYPVSEFDRRAADISVEHPRLVQQYRDAHAIADSARRGVAGTEDLRRATIYFRDLFEDLLQRAARTSAEVSR